MKVNIEKQVEDKGTRKYCPFCKSEQKTLAKTNGAQRWYYPDRGIQWFKRDLICQNCEKKFTTVELEEQYLEELIELRDALGKIKLNAEKYLVEANAASISLEKLSEELSVLRALELYKAQSENNDFKVDDNEWNEDDEWEDED